MQECTVSHEQAKVGQGKSYKNKSTLCHNGPLLVLVLAWYSTVQSHVCNMHALIVAIFSVASAKGIRPQLLVLSYVLQASFSSCSNFTTKL